MNITASQVNELRKQTGAGMMDCKKALVESNGDMEQAIDFLRKKGQKVAAKRADREAKDGVVIAKSNADNSYAAVLMINCETDFVAKNEDFVKYAESILDLAISNKVKEAEALKKLKLDDRTVEETITDQTGVIGEKIDLGAFAAIEAPFTTAYIHPGNRLATIIGLNQPNGEKLAQIGRELAMQVAAMDPVGVDEADVPQDIILREIEIGMDQARNEGKPEAMLEKIAKGKLNKFYRDNTLLNQDFVRENKKSVRQYLSEVDADLTVTAFKRFMLG
ncbi:MAG: translation elongation factor Ts [Bacteroidetes bacterium]|jgi:elongation factor Ts|nr:translation elongation factor Ts [Bacteroidota bacterium]MBU1580129.1 translation elongation factor Ts [Bacteroidota bacterium]MBU2466187.1 translation elongation factor Ts [Bacteroidota bacterium]MBU2557668.1 translation elongation factor Ts [Bacteroidota bacterium]MDA3944406.1 translation elongation factor Ts [Bacteroidota bacterium]